MNEVCIKHEKSIKFTYTANSIIQVYHHQALRNTFYIYSPIMEMVMEITDGYNSAGDVASSIYVDIGEKGRVTSVDLIL